MDNLSLIELKQIAKTRKIKQYYIMKRSQLIKLLSMTELPESFRIEKMTIHQLRDEAKRKNVRGFWTLRREQLVELLFPSADKTTTDKDEKDQGDTNKHNHPEQHDPEDVGIEDV